ncbi:MAG: hypothetical protein Q8Q88_22630 [Phenylobacterium sp.]|uniref:calcium-binding protein n=1 Tax=Phenylobacterium sp. TaxID=1871053 RepID=UPI002735E81C|nr:hypothetical protein [Phenylobacterium sp.]MDP3749836.1 hypothetical protein [Phenylobacterium sp.]
MTFSLSFVEWYSPSVTWGQALTTPSTFQITAISNALTTLASTSSGAALLSGYSASTPLRIGIGTSNHSQYSPTGGWYALSLDFSIAEYYLNPTGKWVLGDDVLVLAHELAHVDTANGPGINPDSSDTASNLNSNGYDYDGYQIQQQNIVALELGLSSKVQLSYGSGIGIISYTSRGFVDNYSYSFGNTIDAARVVKTANEIVDTSNSPNGNASSRDLIFGASGNDTITTGAGADYAYGAGGNDSANGGDAADYLAGEAGSDTLLGEAGADTLEGGDGNDSLRGGDGDDSISGGDGNDTVNASQGTDTVSGGPGSDLLIVNANTVTIEADEGADTLIVTTSNSVVQGGDESDIIVVTGDQNYISGGAGDDYIELLPPSSGGYSVDGHVAPLNNTIVFAKGDGHDTYFMGDGFYRDGFVNNPAARANFLGQVGSGVI